MESERSFMKIRNGIEPRTLPWGSPSLARRGDERTVESHIGYESKGSQNSTLHTW